MLFNGMTFMPHCIKTMLNQNFIYFTAIVGYETYSGSTCHAPNSQQMSVTYRYDCSLRCSENSTCLVFAFSYLDQICVIFEDCPTVLSDGYDVNQKSGNVLLFDVPLASNEDLQLLAKLTFVLGITIAVVYTITCMYFIANIIL